MHYAAGEGPILNLKCHKLIMEEQKLILGLVSWSLGVQQKAKRIYLSLGEDVKKLRNTLTIF